MLQNPFALRPSYTTLNATFTIPFATLYNPPTTACNTFTTPLRRSTTRSQSHHNALRHVHNPITMLYNPTTVSLQRHTTLPQRSTTRSQSHHNALRPYCSFVTNANTTLLQRVHNPITTLYDPSTVSLQRLTTLLQRSTTRSRSLLQFRLQRHTTLPQRSTTRSQSHHNALQRVHNPFYSF